MYKSHSPHSSNLWSRWLFLFVGLGATQSNAQGLLLAVLRNYFCLHSGNHIECWKQNLGLPHARQVLYHLFSLWFLQMTIVLIVQEKNVLPKDPWSWRDSKGVKSSIPSTNQNDSSTEPRVVPSIPRYVLFPSTPPNKECLWLKSKSQQNNTQRDKELQSN